MVLISWTYEQAVCNLDKLATSKPEMTGSARGTKVDAVALPVVSNKADFSGEIGAGLGLESAYGTTFSLPGKMELVNSARYDR